MADYLPEEAPSSKAMEIMEEEFEGTVPNTRVMIKDVTIPEALNYKEELLDIEGVNDVMWLDDATDIKTPIEMMDSDTVESYYKDSTALFSLAIEEGEEVAATEAIYELIGDDNAIAGEAVNTADSQKMAGTESMYAAALLIPIIIIILILSTNSWAEPVFFLTAIGVSVLINLGTNIFIGEVSFVTQSVAPILQLAVSLDYAIFLLHSFNDNRKRMGDPHKAMLKAMKSSFPAIASSASTTFFGFMALSLMEFEIGSDLGINLVKGILLSFISVVIFLPAITMLFYKWIDKTEHRPLIPPIKGVGKFVVKIRYIVVIVVAILIIPAFLAQSNTNFIYGIGEQPETTRTGSDKIAIEEEFGQLTSIVLLVPKGDLVKETKLTEEMENLPSVKNVLSYTNTVSPVIPPDYLDESVTEQFYSENYARIIINTESEAEGEESFAFIEEVQEKSNLLYDDVYLLGEGVTLYDIKETVERDNSLVNILTVVTIAIVLLITFRSISYPIILLLTIQTAVWINLSFPYFTDSPLVFVGYLIISTVQLAATVDYAILFSEAYKEKRKVLPKSQALKETLDEKLFSIIISASILSSVGFILWFTSSNPIVSSIGLLLGRGALLAFVLVVFFLPAMLYLFDRVVQKTTWRSTDNKGSERNEENI
ncbi:efflux RND transporter permease subunit [Gracilibacillus halotolerans]|nr:MMPL family transporter [Gracilibacillus halotolerans]